VHEWHHRVRLSELPVMSQREYRHDHVVSPSSTDPGTGVSPGKVTLTSRLQRRATSAPPPAGEHAAAAPDRHALRAQQDQMLAQTMGFFDEPLRDVQRAQVQLSTDIHTGLDDTQVQAAAAHGTAGPGGSLPHLDAIQRSFGAHDVSGVIAHVGGAASDASAALGAHAYATGDHVAFAEAPSLALAAHEAAHVVQQRAGVQLSAACGQAGDEYEQHADAVAARVVAGESAADLLGSIGGAGVQRAAIQRRDRRDPTDAPGHKGPPVDVRGPTLVENVRARIQEIRIVDGKPRVRISKGTDHGVLVGSPCHQLDKLGRIINFSISDATETFAYATVEEASYDLVQEGNPIVTVNPT
jgi:hypothetical protein